MLNNLECLSGDIADAAEKALSSELLRVSGAAKKLATVNFEWLRGLVTTGVEREPDGDIVGTVGTNVSYAAYVEFGTGPRGAESAKDLPPGMNPTYRADGWTYRNPKTGEFRKTNGQPARPFLYPAWRLNRDRVRENVMKAISRALKGAG